MHRKKESLEATRLSACAWKEEGEGRGGDFEKTEKRRSEIRSLSSPLSPFCFGFSLQLFLFSFVSLLLVFPLPSCIPLSLVSVGVPQVVV